jgi:outer membrane receptor protein involved in Fe transport
LTLSRTLLACVALGLTTHAAAAGIEPAPTLGEVVVTATRSPQSLLTYAGSITRLSADDISWTGATHHSELVNQAPGAFIQRGSGEESLTALRSPVLTGAGSCGAFLFLEDGIPIRPVGFCNVNELFEVNYEQAAAIEVLRGTGSALYGSNAVHGIINVLNPGPEDLPPLGLALEVGPDEYVRGRLALSGAPGSATAGIAMHATHDGGWRDHSGLDEQKLSASLVQPTAQGELTLRLNATNLDQDTAGFILGKDAYKDPALARSNPNPEAYRKAWSVRASAQYLRPLANGDELDLRMVLRSSSMQFLQHFLLGQPVEKNGQDSAEILLSRTLGLGDRSRLTFGLDGELASGSLLQEQDGPTLDGPPAANAIRPAGKQYDYIVDSTLLAPYLQWQQTLDERLTLTAGLRFEWLVYDYDNNMLDGNTDENGVPCPGPGCLYTRPADRRDSFTNWGPRLGLNYRLSDSTAAWMMASRGFRPPEATELYRLQRGQQVADLGSERIDGLEAGIRHLGRTATVELAAFWMEKDNIILRDSFGFNVSGGRTRHRGIEYDLGWTMGHGWRLAASGTWALHTYEFSGGIEQGEQVIRGDDVDTAPRQLHSARLGYDRGRLAAELEWQHVGAYWANAANTARYPGHDLLNLRLAFQLRRNLSATVRIANLADTAYADRADYAFGDYRYFPGRGRAAFLEMSWQQE